MFNTTETPMTIQPPSIFDTKGFELSRSQSLPFDPTKDHTLLLEQLIAACTEFNYLGISPQNLDSPAELERIIVLRTEQEFQTFLNPRIEEQKGSRECREGCANIHLWKNGERFIPGVRTIRPLEITLSFLESDGERKFQRFQDPPTVDVFENTAVSVICHEVDHLNGRLITDMAHERLGKELTRFSTENASTTVLMAAFTNMPFVLLFSGDHYVLHHGIEFLNTNLPPISPDCVCLDRVFNSLELLAELRIMRDGVIYKIEASKFIGDALT